MRKASIEFLEALISTPSPSGSEGKVADLYRSYILPYCHEIRSDVMGNVTGIINPNGITRVMYCGHMDEIGFIVHHIDESGFLYFSSIGGIDITTEVGQRVVVHGSSSLPGVIGRKAIQTFGAKDSREAPALSDLWIDIGASTKEEAEKVAPIGTSVTLAGAFTPLRNSLVMGRAFDNKAGLFIGAEVLRVLSEDGGLADDVGLFALGTTQEEIGSRGAITAAYAVDPTVAIVVDMGVATDYPRADVRDQGLLRLGAGPAIALGPNTNKVVGHLLLDAATANNISHQRQAVGTSSPTDARVVQTSRSGVATGLLSVPLRYMHTPAEVLSLDDLEATIQLVCTFLRRINSPTKFAPW